MIRESPPGVERETVRPKGEPQRSLCYQWVTLQVSACYGKVSRSPETLISRPWNRSLVKRRYLSFRMLRSMVTFRYIILARSYGFYTHYSAILSSETSSNDHLHSSANLTRNPTVLRTIQNAKCIHPEYGL
jgi:hypothetical protein